MIKIATQICHRDVTTAITCLRSLLRRTYPAASLQLYEDGSLTADDRELLVKSLGPCRLITKEEREDIVSSHLESYPCCRAFRSDNVFATKGIDIPLMAEDEIVYCDSDVYFFRACELVFDREHYDADAVFMLDIQETYNVRPWHLIGPNALRLASRICAGFILMRRDFYNLDLIEWVLKRYQGAFRRFPWVTEQVLWAALAANCRSATVDDNQISIVEPGYEVGSSSIAGHFVSTHRNLLNAYISSWEHRDEKAARLPSAVPSRKCTAARLTIDRLRCRAARLLNL